MFIYEVCIFQVCHFPFILNMFYMYINPKIFDIYYKVRLFAVVTNVLVSMTILLFKRVGTFKGSSWAEVGGVHKKICE